MKWGQPQAPIGAAPAAPAPAPKPDEKPPIWAADLRLTPNGKFLYTTERNTDKMAAASGVVALVSRKLHQAYWTL
jgi:hypothetical protein